MGSYLFFLFYYTLITSVAFFAWSFFAAPKPEGFILALLQVPIVFYFWIRTMKKSTSPTHPINTSHGHRIILWVSVAILTTLFISSFSLLSYLTLAGKNKKDSNGVQNSYLQLSSDIRDIQKELRKLRIEERQNSIKRQDIEKIVQEKLNNVKGAKIEPTDTKDSKTASTSGSVGFVTIKDEKWTKVNLYKERSYSSTIVGEVEFGKNYFYTKKEDSWYYIAPTIGDDGWINAKFVKIVADETL